MARWPVVTCLDQTRLPSSRGPRSTRWTSYEDAVSAIRDMRVRGAPDIGVTAAYADGHGGPGHPVTPTQGEFLGRLWPPHAMHIRSAQADCGQSWLGGGPNAGRSRVGSNAISGDVPERLLLTGGQGHPRGKTWPSTARMGEFGKSSLMPDGGSVLTHCNTGALATSFLRHGPWSDSCRLGESGKTVRGVYNTETRPWRQGAQAHIVGISEAGYSSNACWWIRPLDMLMRQGKHSLRNHWGRPYGSQRRSRPTRLEHTPWRYWHASTDIPFYVAAPTSTVDLVVGRRGPN